MIYREIIPLKQKPNWQVTLPGSKSITNRVFLCAALARGKSKIYGALKSDDADVMLRALKRVGVKVKKIKDYIEVIGKGGKFDKGKRTFDLHNAGTATRFLTAAMILREGQTIITGNKRMQERPIKDLVDGLKQIGVDIEYLGKKGCPPLRMTNDQFPMTNEKEYVIEMKGDKSSQYFSALLMLGPILDKPLRIKVIGDLVSKPYIDITIGVMKEFGIRVGNREYKEFCIKPQTYKSGTYTVEGDASAASYWTSIARLHDGEVEFTNLTKHSIQGDIKYEEALNRLMPRASFSARVIDMGDMPDSAMTLAAIAPFIKPFSVGKQGHTTITGLSTLRIKETDRLKALENELKRIGVDVKTMKDSISIGSATGSEIGTAIGTYNDHRMAMCFAVVGTKVPGIVIRDPGCVDKTYPNFWNDLELAYLSPIELEWRNLILTGMRCSGKTYLGKKIAKHLGREFVDLDLEIENNAKIDIKRIVKKHGWKYFRELEQKICSSYKNSRNLVIATGGGVILNPKNMEALKKNGVNVFIFADTSTIIERIKKQSKNRPTLTGKGTIKEIKDVWKERRDLYLKYADYVWDDTSGTMIEENLSRIFKP